MIHITLLLADCILVGYFNDSIKCWQVELADALSGKRFTTQFDERQMAAIVALGLSGECFTAELNKALYEIAEPALKDCPKECRPIP